MHCCNGKAPADSASLWPCSQPVLCALDNVYRTPLHAACRFGHHDVVCALLKKGAMVDARDGTCTSVQCVAAFQSAAAAEISAALH
jgi:ankyrin repeat protein